MTTLNTSENEINNLGYVVAPEASETAGALSYWRLSGSIELIALRNAWLSQGLDTAVLPEPPTDEVALRRAVLELQGKRRVVRPLAKRGSWVVKDESVTSDGRDVDQVRVCTVTFENGSMRIEAGEAAFDTYSKAHDEIRANFTRMRGELSATDVSQWLIDLANKRSSVSLRDSGGIYFLPKPAMEFWRKVATAIHIASPHKIFVIPAIKNSEAIDAIFDAVVAEANKMVAAIETELLAEGDEALGRRALDTRVQSCESMLSKIAGYETLLGVPFDMMRGRVEDLRANVAAAALKSDASDDAAA